MKKDNLPLQGFHAIAVKTNGHKAVFNSFFLNIPQLLQQCLNINFNWT